MQSKKNIKNNQTKLDKLKIKTFKGRVLALIVSFVFVGGGIMVYKSFAASTINVYSSKGCGSLPPKNCSVFDDPAVGGDISKNPGANSVVQYVNTYDINLNTDQNYPTYPKAGIGQSYRGCMIIRPMTSLVVEQSTGITRNSWSLAASSSYRTYCTGWAKNDRVINFDPLHYVSISKYGKLRLAKSWMEIGIPDAPLSPAPTSEPTPPK